MTFDNNLSHPLSYPSLIASRETLLIDQMTLLLGTMNTLEVSLSFCP